ncbi:MAG: lycopene cyclase [Bacteroidetes bacterium]|nr:lycopene cyclase [Bacteroidota bacterium]
MPDYDFCITGAGCAGLSLLVRILSTPPLQKKKILLVDSHTKKDNDRTWCFWEKGEGYFENLVHRRWSSLQFHDGHQSRLLDTAPYIYKMIRGIDFYTYCFRFIQQFDNVVHLHGKVESLHSDAACTCAVIDGRKITAGRIFNSIPSPAPAAGRHWLLLQHFRGWVIRSLRPVFTPQQGTIMDFRTTQQYGTSFFYVLPHSPTEALVECTFFTDSLLPDMTYTHLLTRYISKVLRITDYVILEREEGVIPMSTATYPHSQHRIHHIGAAAGLTKPSTGYTFKNIQRDCAAIVRSLANNNEPSRKHTSPRFRLYDRIMLNVLVTKKLSGQHLFSSLFTHTHPADLLAFLDETSTPSQDWRIIRSLPKAPFLRAMLGELFQPGPGYIPVRPSRDPLPTHTVCSEE